MSGNDSTDPGSDSVAEEVNRPVPSVPSVVFLVGRAVPGQPGATVSYGRVAGAVDDAGVIASDIGDAGGVLIDLAHDVLAARFESVAAAVRTVMGTDSALPVLSTLRSSGRCWAVHRTDARQFGGLDPVAGALRRAAAVSAIGHAGQVLISDPAWSALAAEGVFRTDAVDLGVHRLGALPRPERIWQLGDRRGGFPSLRSTGAFRQNLPSRLAPLIGREDQVVEISGLLARERLLTLTGAGGVGKTSLALASAAAAVASFDRTCWVDLSDIVEPHGLPGAILESAGLWPAVDHPLAPNEDPISVVRSSTESMPHVISR